MGHRFLPSAILISGNAEDALFVTALASELGLEPKIFGRVCDAEAYVQAIKASAGMRVFVDASDRQVLKEFSSRIGPRVGRGHGLIAPANVSLIVNPTISGTQRVALARNPHFGDLIFRQYGDPADAGRYFAKFLRAADAQPQAAAPVPSPVPSVQLQSLEEKPAALKSVEDFLRTHTGFQDRMIFAIIASVDELILNAFVDARQDSVASPLPEGPQRVELLVRRSEGSISISVTDHYGSFDRQKALGRILRSKDSDEKIEGQATPGCRMGVGLTFALKLGASLGFNIRRGQWTEATVSYKEVSSYREFRQQFQALSIHSD
jgi:hypothetical protein